ncbi:Uma2 family endonuclease [Candidatus Leptofilum sp.]|uniref:Uma2 family endonuclease n=1 Tax=Candidatus Leptofilum sp. TaxID=3241576 RepID=UPI003B5BD5ED
MTIEELAKLPPDQSRGELIQGEFFSMSPAGHSHGIIALNISSQLWLFVKQNKLGNVYAAETGFILARNPDTVRAPDAAFVQQERLSHQPETGFFEGAPDLAVEVISPSETVDDVESKVIDYLNAGTQLVWLIYPRTRTVTVYRSLTDIHILTTDDVLEGGTLLPGFSVLVKEIFE